MLEKDLSTARRHRLGGDHHCLLYGFLLQCGDLLGALLSVLVVQKDPSVERVQYVRRLTGREHAARVHVLRSRSSMELERLLDGGHAPSISRELHQPIESYTEHDHDLLARQLRRAEIVREQPSVRELLRGVDTLEDCLAGPGIFSVGNRRSFSHSSFTIS